MVNSVLETNPDGAQIERDKVVLDTELGSEAAFVTLGVAPIEDLMEDAEYFQSETIQDSGTDTGNLANVSSDGSNTKTRGLRHLLSRSMCRIGSHRGKWEYLSEAQCSQSRTCSQCGNAKMRIKHKLAWRYLGKATCQGAMTCRRCDIVPMKTVYLSPDGLIRDRVIPGDTQVDLPKHGFQIQHSNWGQPWEIGRDQAAHRCFRCGTVEKFSTADPD